jgi:hypothetical protein
MIYDFLNHTIDILQHIVVPKPNYLATLVDKPFIPPHIRNTLIMLTASNLDYDPFFKTDKIHNIPAHCRRNFTPHCFRHILYHSLRSASVMFFLRPRAQYERNEPGVTFYHPHLNPPPSRGRRKGWLALPSRGRKSLRHKSAIFLACPHST